jgi:DNA gyrase inhibitor GyrI
MTIEIKRLQPQHVAVLRAGEPDAELRALNGVLDWARARGYLTDTYRLFGYDNCLPGDQHIYTAWVTVSAAAQPDDQVAVVDFPGGLYAAMPVRAEGEAIKAGWEQLDVWLPSSSYRPGAQPCLEEHHQMWAGDWRIELWLSLAE